MTSSSTRRHELEAGDRVRVREGVTGGVTAGETGTVHSVGPLDAARPIRAVLDDDGPEPREFALDELELIEAARS